MTYFHDEPQGAEPARENAAPIDTFSMRAAFVQAQAQIMNNGTFEPVVVISKPLALSLLDEIDRLRRLMDAAVPRRATAPEIADPVERFVLVMNLGDVQ